MRAWTVHEYGHYGECMRLGESEPPRAEGENCVIEVKAAGVMYADLLNISGRYQVRAPLPFVPGSEAAGVVVEAGSASRFRPGDRIIAVNLIGAFAERMLGLDQTAHVIPDGMSFEDAAAFTINYQTAYFALVHRARLQRGETVLVHGGAGGVGTAAIQLAKSLGATVIATAGTDQKTAICRACGADHAINYAETDFGAIVKDLTGGHGADVIVDPVGGDVFDKSVKCIAFEGRLVVIGFAGGRIAELATNRALLKNMSVMGLFWGNYQTRNEALVRETQEALYDLYRRGAIKPIIYERYPLERLPEALGAIECRRSHGKPVLIV